MPVLNVAAAIIVSLFPCLSAADGIIEEQLETSGAYELHESLPEETQELLESSGIELSADGMTDFSAAGMVDSLSELCSQAARKPAGACLSALCVVVLCALAGTVAGKEGADLTAAFDTVSIAAVSAAVCVPAAEFIDGAASGISSACSFSAVLVPVLSGLAAASGHSASAAAGSAVTLSVIEAMNVVIPEVVIPVIRMLLGIASVSSMCPSMGLDKLTASMEKNANRIILTYRGKIP